jgi:hypothetical protein
MKGSRLLICSTAAALTLLGSTASSAFAADLTPSNVVYGNVAGNSAGGSPHGAGPAASLPFTGADVLVYAVAGLGMAGTGIALRRSARPRS